MPDDATQAALDKYYKARNDVGASSSRAQFHGDDLLGTHRPKSTIWGDIWAVVRVPSAVANILGSRIPIFNKFLPPLNNFGALSIFSGAPEGSYIRKFGVEFGVTRLWDAMLHPPLSYISDQFQYRTADGSFNSVTQPNLGRGGTPYAKSVEPKEALLGAKPDPGDIFDLLMARDNHFQQSGSGLSSMLLYHATIIIHDIFRTNQADFNIADTSSYLDLSPLYGHTQKIQDSIRTFKDGMLKPDTFAEERLLRQPPGVCVMLVMYSRYHNYVAGELKKINEGGRFSLPPWCYLNFEEDWNRRGDQLEEEIKQLQAKVDAGENGGVNKALDAKKAELALHNAPEAKEAAKTDLEARIKAAKVKQDYDLFNTARLITSGLYINIAIHDYLKALMGLHASNNSTWVLDPRLEFDRQKKPRGTGNQVSVEFNLLYRFHCAISKRDEQWASDLLNSELRPYLPPDIPFSDISIEQFRTAMGKLYRERGPIDPDKTVFGSSKMPFLRRNSKGEIVPPGTGGGTFDDDQLVQQLINDLSDPIGQFGPLNIPNDFKVIEMMGILQARKWGVATLNEFREFFGLPRHQKFEDISKNVYIQDKLRDLYEHVDKVELYPGAFCESTKSNKLDPGDPESSQGTTLWGAIFSDAVTLVRSDRFYTIDWNVERLTAWGMKEVTPNPNVLKGSVFHRLIQRAFPGRFPYDSVALSHPFYTPAKNEEIAVKQGYVKELDLRPLSANKAKKIWILKDYANIARVLSPTDDVAKCFWSLASFDRVEITQVLRDAIRDRDVPDPAFSANPALNDVKPLLLTYFTSMAEKIIARERIVMKVTKPAERVDQVGDSAKNLDYSKVYSVDITRDVAIPVITRFVADFLGFGNHIKSEENPKGKYKENEIYRHITNVHVFISLNADETKMLQHRQAFVESIKFLFELTKPGVLSANAWIPAPKWWRNKGLEPYVAQVRDFGVLLARSMYREKKSIDKATAALLVTALFGAYNTVIMFTEVLAFFLPTGHAGLYDKAWNKVDGDPEDPPEDFEKNGGHVRPSGSQYWREVQDLAEKNDDASNNTIEKYVMEAQRLVTKIPVARTVLKRCPAMEGNALDSKGKVLPDHDASPFYEVGDTVVLNVWAASKNPAIFPKPYKLDITRENPPYLTYGVGKYQTKTKNITVMALTGLIKATARLRMLRRGHDTQGRLKTVDIKSMGKDFFNYMSPDWSEYTPFPTTWKVRYDGPSPGKELGKEEKQDHGVEYLYQPWGPSHFGGTFVTHGIESEEFRKQVKEALDGSGGNIRPGCGAALGGA